MSGYVHFRYMSVIIPQMTFLVKQRISDLFKWSKGDKRECCLLTMVKEISPNTNFQLLVALCIDTEFEDIAKEYSTSKWNFGKAVRSGSKEIDIKDNYNILLKHNEDCGTEFKKSPIQFQTKDTYRHKTFPFTCTTEGQNPYTMVFCLKGTITYVTFIRSTNFEHSCIYQ